MNVYHLTITHHFEAAHYDASNLFEILHQCGDLFASLTGAQRAAQADAELYAESQRPLGRRNGLARDVDQL